MNKTRYRYVWEHRYWYCVKWEGLGKPLIYLVLP